MPAKATLTFLDNHEAARAVTDLLTFHEDQLSQRDYERVSRLRDVKKFTEGERHLLAQLIRSIPGVLKGYE
jgi:hypothetical protein